MDKLSVYNYEIPYKDRMIYFNGISGFFFSVSPQEHQFFHQQYEDLISFEIQYNSLFSKMKEWGFIVDATIDELDIIRYRNRKALFLDKSYRLMLYPTLDCNFKCWYCVQNHPKSCMDEATTQKVKNHIQYMMTEEKITEIRLDWFGGEPLLYFDETVYPLAKFTAEEAKKNKIGFYQNITTNASLINEEMVYKMNEIGLNSFQITIDGDEKRHDKIRNTQGKPSFRKIMHNIRLLCNHIENIHINLRINYDDTTLNKADLYSVFEGIDPDYRSKISPMFVRVWQTQKKDLPTNEKCMELYKQCTDLGYQMTVPSNVFSLRQGVRCYADRYYYTEINYNGAVFKCGAKGHGKEREAGVLQEDGRIIWKNKVIQKMYGKATFENKMCLSCKHLPICLGPCSQNILHAREDQLADLCVLRTFEMKPEDFIISLYEQKMKN